MAKDPDLACAFAERETRASGRTRGGARNGLAGIPCPAQPWLVQLRCFSETEVLRSRAPNVSNEEMARVRSVEDALEASAHVCGRRERAVPLDG